MNIFLHHIPSGKMADYVVGDLPLDQRVDLESHLATCAQCSEEMAQLERVVSLMRTDTAEDAPPSLIDSVVDLFRSNAAHKSTSSDWRRRILAALKFDSMGIAPAFGVRSGRSSTRQLLFSAGEYSIDLRIEPAGQAWVVSGQVLGGGTDNGVAVLQSTADMNQTAFNELSEFILPPVQVGTYKLVLNLSNLDVEIDEIVVGL